MTQVLDRFVGLYDLVNVVAICRNTLVNKPCDCFGTIGELRGFDQDRENLPFYVKAGAFFPSFIRFAADHVVVSTVRACPSSADAF